MVALMCQPCTLPEEDSSREIIFLLDRSGSMAGSRLVYTFSLGKRIGSMRPRMLFNYS